MKKSILMMSFFTLIYLFVSGCSKTVSAIESETQAHINSMLKIVSPTHKVEHEKIVTYKIPKQKRCSKKMTLKECFLLQNKSNRKLKYTFIKQRNAVIEHNRLYK